MYALLQWAYITFLNNSLELFNNSARFFIPLTIWLGVAQGILALVIITAGFRQNWNKNKKISNPLRDANLKAARVVIISSAFILLSYTLSPLLGGPVWAESERFDQTIQFLPFFMLICFLSPFIFQFPDKFNKVIHKLAYSMASAYVVVNILAGFFMIQSELDYRGSYLSWSNMDAPLVQKMQAVDFIATDWKASSNAGRIPVDYQLEGGIWSYISTLGNQYDAWYPSPMTYGRSFDYDLLRRYGLLNSQEGMEPRTFGTGRYLVTYAFEPSPKIPGVSLQDFYFGRIRVSITNR